MGRQPPWAQPNAPGQGAGFLGGQGGPSGQGGPGQGGPGAAARRECLCRAEPAQHHRDRRGTASHQPDQGAWLAASPLEGPRGRAESNGLARSWRRLAGGRSEHRQHRRHANRRGRSRRHQYSGSGYWTSRFCNRHSGREQHGLRHLPEGRFRVLPDGPQAKPDSQGPGGAELGRHERRSKPVSWRVASFLCPFLRSGPAA